MKILILSSRFPFPIEKGDKLRLFHQMRMLSRKHELVLCSLHEGEVSSDNYETVAQYCSKIYLFPLSKWGLGFNLSNVLLGQLPLSVAYFFRNKLKKKIVQCIANEAPDHIYCQLIRMLPYLPEASCPVTLDYMDAFSMGMQRRMWHSSWWMKPFLSLEAKALKRYEQDVFAKVDYHTMIAEADRAIFPPAQAKQIRIIPNGVDTQYFAFEVQESAQFDLIFVGNLGYFPNVQAATYLIEEIRPKLLRELPALKILIAGARPANAIKAFSKLMGVEVWPWVEDIRIAYRAGKVFVAPLFTGSGQQNKILEAMALGIPCVTTPTVNSAIGAGEEVMLLAEDANTFAQQILSLLRAEDRRTAIARKGARFIKERYSWEAADQQLQALWE